MNQQPADTVQIEVVYAEPDHQELLPLAVPLGTTAAQALELANLGRHFPNVNFSNAELGVWGQPVDCQYRMQNGDRLEVYRPLVMDPREARRQLALHGRAMGQKQSDDEA